MDLPEKQRAEPSPRFTPQDQTNAIPHNIPPHEINGNEAELFGCN